jgi:hypothetical protein
VIGMGLASRNSIVGGHARVHGQEALGVDVPGGQDRAS